MKQDEEKRSKQSQINFVAKHARKFNKCVAFKLKTKYNRKNKSWKQQIQQ